MWRWLGGVRFAGQIIYRSVKKHMSTLRSNVHISVRPTHEPCLQHGKKPVPEASKKTIEITDKFLDCIFLGIKQRSEEFIVGTPARCVEFRICQRTVS